MTKIEILGAGERVPTGELRPHPLNDNKQSKYMFDKLVATIRKDGFAQPITVRTGNEKGKFKDGMYEIIGGEHRWRAAMALDMEEVPIHNLGNIPDLRAKKLLLGLNKLHGESDHDALSKLLREINAESAEELANLPFDDDMLKDLLDGEAASTPGGDLWDNEEVEDTHTVDLGTKPSARDLLVILGIQNLSKGDVVSLLDTARQWAFGREDQSEAPWQSLVALMVKHTRKVDD